MTGILCSMVGSHPMRVRLQYLVIAGGGGGGGGVGVENGSGGGAGGMIEQTVDDIKGETFTISVGAGGSLGTYSPWTAGGNGGNSVLSNGSWLIATAIGGGGGSAYNLGAYDKNGGSGGAPGALALQPSQTGYSFGYGHNGAYHAGGGGAGGTGGGEVGGAGRASTITGSSVVYAIGGGGSTLSAWSYGGGGNAPNSHGNGQAGKAGVVILRVSKVAKSYTGSPTITSVGSDTVYKFTGAGSITF